MFRSFTATLAALMIALSGLALAGARGTGGASASAVAICSGFSVTTISIGPDGQPVKHVRVCPDGAAHFVATFAMPALPRPVARLVTVLAPMPCLARAGHARLSPSARDPPLPA